MKTSFSQNDTTYTTTEIKIKNTTFRITVAKGQSNYVNVNKISHIRGLGKDFENFDAATSHYKKPEIKLALLKIEMGLS